MVRGQGLNSSGLKVTERTPEFTSRTMGSVLFSMFMIITLTPRAPPARNRVETQLQEPTICSQHPSSHFLLRQKERALCFLLGHLPDQRLDSEEERTAEVWGRGNHPFAAQGKVVHPPSPIPRQGQPMKSAYHLDGLSSKGHINMWKKIE